MSIGRSREVLVKPHGPERMIWGLSPSLNLVSVLVTEP